MSVETTTSAAEPRRGLRIRWRRPDSLPRWARVALVVFAAFFVIGWAGWLSCGFRGCPAVGTLASFTPDGAPVLLDRDGEPFAELKPAGHRVVELEDLPEHVAAAFVAVEDRRFRQHDGVDWRRVVGALLANLRAREIEEGSSTITMQLARNVFPDRIEAQRKTLGRKLLEARVARKIESEFSKDEILELYLNYIYFGGGARGIDAASRLYFDKSPTELTLDEAALLAALPKAPSHYDPRRHPERARERRDLVLDLMVEQGRIDEDEAAAAREAELDISKGSTPPRSEIAFAPYFVEEVRSRLEERFGDAIYTEPLRIRTTLDRNAQTAAAEELARQLERIENGTWGRFDAPRYDPGDELPQGSTEYLQGAAVVVAADTGDVLAWVGGRDFLHSRFDRVEDARRQIGSAFKPFVYATALAQGHTLSERLVDRPIEIPLDRRRTWRPENFGDHYEGLVSVREALVRSKNVPTVRLAQAVGTVEVAETAREMGLPGDRIPRTPAMALGTASLSPVELAAAYTAFANLGERVEPRLILEVTRPDGEVLWETEVEEERVIDPAVAFLVTDALSDAVSRGTGAAVRQAGLTVPAAGKTGTTNDRRDTWFVGYTPEMVGAVWIGFDQPRTIVPGAEGGRLAAPVWGRMMRRVYASRPAPEDWQPPGDVVRRAVDPATGYLLADGCAPVGAAPRQEYFLLGTEPQSICPSSPSTNGTDPYLEDWRSRFRAWLDGWGGEEGTELGVANEGYEDYELGTGSGIRVERRPDGSILIENTGRSTESLPPPEPLEPIGPDPRPDDETDDDGIDIEPLPEPELPPVERQPPPQPQPPQRQPPPEPPPAQQPPPEQ
ncbi:MAG TPA: PBP1A family penicillin-binding protein, partial [Thermoanaerobaculia bacterium]|nr:PBP1A family penicillin-binding protein [Thermoanaerobaculia bacterium]